jgi:hypothetical protein
MKVSIMRSRDTAYFDGNLLLTRFAKTGIKREVSCVLIDKLSTQAARRLGIIDALEVSDQLRQKLILRFGNSGSRGGLSAHEFDSFLTREDAEAALERVYCALIAKTRETHRWKTCYRFALALFWVLGCVLLFLGIGNLAANHKEPAPFHSPSYVPSANVPQNLAPAARTDVPPIAQAEDVLADAIHYGANHAPKDKTLYVFADPNCPHCKDYEKELQQLPLSYSLYIFPVAFQPGSLELVSRIMCAKDPVHAWRLALSGKSVIGNACEKGSAIATRNTSLFRGLHFAYTPTTVSESGATQDGYISKDTLIKWLNGKI